MMSVLRPSGVVPVTVRNQHGPSASCLRRPFRRRRFSLSRSNAAREGLRRGDVLDGEADQPVEGLQQIDVHLAAFVRAGALDLELVGGGVGERLHVEQRLAAARLHVEHVAEHVLLLEAVRALRLGGVEQGLLRVGAAGLQVVERVLVGFEADDLDDARAALGFLGRGEALGLAVLPLRREGDLLDARQQHRVEVVAHLDEDELAPPAVLAVQVDDGVAGGARASEEVETQSRRPCRSCSERIARPSVDRLREMETRLSPNKSISRLLPSVSRPHCDLVSTSCRTL